MHYIILGDSMTFVTYIEVVLPENSSLRLGCWHENWIAPSWQRCCVDGSNRHDDDDDDEEEEEDVDFYTSGCFPMH